MESPVEMDEYRNSKQTDEDESREDAIFEIVREITDSDLNDGAPEFKEWARRKAEKSIMEKL